MPGRILGIAWTSAVMTMPSGGVQTLNHTLGRQPVAAIPTVVGTTRPTDANTLRVDQLTDTTIRVRAPQNVRYRVFALA